MPQERKARAVGFNHVALEVGDIEQALAFYGRLFEFELRGKSATSAFIDLGDQFLALQKGRKQGADDGRHFGLVVDDKEAVRRALSDAGIKPLPGRFLDFLDPWGNRIEIVGYDNIQFSKAPNVLRGMGLAHLSKNASAIKGVAGNAPHARPADRPCARAPGNRAGRLPACIRRSRNFQTWDRPWASGSAIAAVRTESSGSRWAAALARRTQALPIPHAAFAAKRQSSCARRWERPRAVLDRRLRF